MRGAHRVKEMQRRASQSRATHKARKTALMLKEETQMAAVEVRKSKTKVGSKRPLKTTKTKKPEKR